MKKYLAYVPYVFVSAILLMGGVMKLSGQEMALQSFVDLGLPSWFGTFIGVAEIAGAIGIWLPRLSSLAAGGILVIMAGAVYYHVTFPPIPAGVPALLVLLGAIYVFTRGKANAFWKTAS
ncbi:MAG: DoxX family protein [Granulosicoccus sp.]